MTIPAEYAQEYYEAAERFILIIGNPEGKQEDMDFSYVQIFYDDGQFTGEELCTKLHRKVLDGTINTFLVIPASGFTDVMPISALFAYEMEKIFNGDTLSSEG